MLKNMRLFRLAFYILLGAVVWQGNLAVAQSLTNDNATEASMVVNQYMQALMQGDTEIVRSLLIDNELARKSSMLKNPTYPGFLQKIYNNAQYQISNTELSGADKIIVDVLVTYASQEKAKFRLWLRNTDDSGMRIFFETE